MKIKYMLLALMPLCLASCSEEETVVSAGNQREVRVTAGVGAHSRMVLNDKGQYTESLWQSGDEISLFTSTQSNLVYSTSLEGTSASASFTATGESLQYIEGNEVYACYPTAEAIGEGNQLVKLSPNSSFDYNEGTVRSFCYAVDKISKGSLNFKFKHISAFISLNVTQEMLGGKSLSHGKIMVSTSSTTPLTIGDGDYFDFTTQTATTVNGGNSLVMTMGHVKDSLGTVYLPVLPQPAGADITITLADSEGNDIYTQTKRTPASGFLAGNVYKMDTSASFEVAYLVDGPTFNQSIKDLVSGGSPEDYLIGKIQFVTESYQVPEYHVVVSAEGSAVPVYASFNQADSLLTISTAAKRMEIEDASSMFSSLTSLRTIDFGNFKINETTTSMSSMFNTCSKLTDLDLSNWNIMNVKDLSYVFHYCFSLTNLEISNWDTSNVTTMQGMFTGCSKLSNLNVSNWNTANVTNLGTVFLGCESLTELDVSDWDTSNVTYMAGVFWSCEKLLKLDVSKWNTTNATDMRYMFSCCFSLSSLDLSGFDMTKVTELGFMFERCASDSKACKVASTKEIKEFLLSKTGETQMNPEWFIWDVDGEVAEVAYLVAGQTFNERIKQLANGNPNLVYYDSDYLIGKIEFVTESSNIPTGHILVSADNSPTPIYAFFNQTDYLLTISTAAKRMEIEDASDMFSKLKSLCTIDFGNFCINETTTDMNCMFAVCSSLSSLDLSSFNTSNVRNMSRMFITCTSLANLDLSSFNTSNVTDMSMMFTNCASSANLDLSNFDTSNVADVRSMFYGCSSLEDLDLSGFDMSRVYCADSMFYNCASTSQACKVASTQKAKDFLLSNIDYTLMNLAWFIWGDAENNGSGFNDMSKEEW